MLSRPSSRRMPQEEANSDLHCSHNKITSTNSSTTTARTSSRSSMTLLTIFTVCWYYTSSKNAVATQQLVENYQEHISITAGSTSGTMTAAGGNDRPPLPCMLHFAMMASLTALQLFVGLCVATFLSWGILSGSCQGSATTVTSSASSSTTPTPPTKRVASYLISSLHYFGCLFTNLGFAYGSASIVQVIKLLEPIETLILTFVVNVCISKLHKKNSVHHKLFFDYQNMEDHSKQYLHHLLLI